MKRTRLSRRHPGRASVFLAAAACAAAPLAGRAADPYYVGGAGAGNWNVPGNWSTGAVPAGGANVNFMNSDGLSRVLNYDYAGPAVTLNSLTIDQTGSGSNTLQMPGFDLTTGSTTAGSWGGRGGIVQSGGTHKTNQLGLGFNPGTVGTYALSDGGSLVVIDATLMGYSGRGEFVQTGGTHKARNLFMGAFGRDALGTYSLSGSGRLEVAEWEFVGASAFGDFGTGSFAQSGGVNATYGLMVGGGQGGHDLYTLSGDGTLTVGSYVGVNSGGTFEQTGGAHTVPTLGVSGTAAAPAAYVLSGGRLEASAGVGVGGGKGTLTQSGGTQAVGGLQIGGGQGAAPLVDGTVNLSGGTLAVSGNVDLGGANDRAGDRAALNVSGGTLTATGSLKVWNAGGAVTASGGSVAVGQVVNSGLVRAGTSITVAGGVANASGAGAGSAGRLAVDAGGSVVANFVRQQSLELNGPTTNPPAPGPVVSIRPKADGGGTSVVASLAIATGADGSPVGRVDLADNALVVDYGATSPIATVRSLIRSAWAGGAWTGNGITSSAAAAAPAGSRGLGYGEAIAIPGASGTFEGQPTDGTAVLVKFTVMGDATLDGRVNFDDLLSLAKHYNATGADWSDGDFDYNTTVNFDDLLVLAKNYNGSLAGPVPGAPVGFDADVAAAFAAVPEPGAMAGFAGIALLLGMRRARRRIVG